MSAQNSPHLLGLLQRASRTFAVAIPLLPRPLSDEVTIAYLLFRIADTFEDAARWSRAERLEGLRELARWVSAPERGADENILARWLAKPPCDHEGYLELVRCTPAVLASLAALAPRSRAIVTEHASRTVEGMSRFVARTQDETGLFLRDLSDLREYCYVVAGIVGELLTALFLAAFPELDAVQGVLERHAPAFGEGLQLVNVLKDREEDERGGRHYVPSGVSLSLLFDLARADLDQATAYVLALQEAGVPRGVVAFTAFPVLLARETLDISERQGPGAKVTRDRVAALVSAMDHAIDKGRPVLGAASQS
jgi:farnesyl-diphosphate farnesyltransferase